MIPSATIRHWIKGRTAAGVADSLSPIFIIGANRSGTSMLSRLIAQHPDLEGLFAGPSPLAAEMTRSVTGHVAAYCESSHIWSGLNEGSRPIDKKSLFGLPENLQHLYRNRARSGCEAATLRGAVLSARKTAKDPVLKDNFNILRIGLIVELFPKARFVLVRRGHETYVPSNLVKWQQSSNGRSPEISMHWLMINLIAQGDLRRYANTPVAEVAYENIADSRESAHRAVQDIFAQLGLPPADIDCSFISDEYRYIGGSRIQEQASVFRVTSGIFDSEDKARN